MNLAQLHLILVHIPLIGLGFALLLNIYALIKRLYDLKILSLWVYIATGISAFFAYITGDGAEKIMKTYPGMSEDIIQPHEYWALYFFIGLSIITVFAFITFLLYRKNKKTSERLLVVLLCLAILLTAIAFKTGLSGGSIRHVEIEDGFYSER